MMQIKNIHILLNIDYMYDCIEMYFYIKPNYIEWNGNLSVNRRGFVEVK